MTEDLKQISYTENTSFTQIKDLKKALYQKDKKILYTHPRP